MQHSGHLIVILLSIIAATSLALDQECSIKPNYPINCTCSYDLNKYQMDCAKRVKDIDKLPAEIDLRVQREKDLSNLTEIAIVNALLVSVPPSVCSMMYLSALNLDHNMFTELPVNCLSKLSHLRSLVLSNNSISNVHGEFLANTSVLPALRYLDLSRNRLKTLGTWPFVRAAMQPGMTINLASNQLSVFTSTSGVRHTPCSTENVALTLNLERNEIRHLSDIFNGWGFNTTIDILCLFNNMNYEHTNFHLLLHGVFYDCDCHDYKFARFMKTMHNNMFDELYCRADKESNHIRYILFPLEEIVCEEEFQPGCRSIQRPWNATFHVQCSNANLTSLPLTLPDSPKSYHHKLDFSGNRITSLEYRPYMDNAAFLDIRDNPVQRVDDDAWRAMRKIQTMYPSLSQLRRLVQSRHSFPAPYRL